MTQKQIRNVLSVLKKIRKELAKRDESYDGENVGLCALIIRYFAHVIVHVKPTMFIPEFTKEYCHTIAPTFGDKSSFWWPTNISILSGICKDHTYYDITSRLKVIDHFIDLYTSKVNNYLLKMNSTN